MADTTFVAKTTKILASWLNQVNDHIFSDTPVSGTTVHDSAFLNFLQAGTGAVARTVQVKMREIKSITDYGADTSNSAALNTTYIQAAIDANYGKALIIPPGTFQIATTGSVVAPVGDALSITDEITLVFQGILKGTNNCNCVHINAGAQDVVTLLYEGGGVQGYGTFFETTNRNGSLIKCTAGIPRIYQIKLIDPPQYAVVSEGADDGHVSEVEIIGGQDTYPGDNNYGICLIDASTGWKIDGCKTLANATGGKVSQAVASITLGTGTATGTQILNNRFLNQWEKGVYLFGADAQINGNHVYNCAQGEGIRVIGARPQVNDNIVRSCVGGGITLYDAGGAVCADNNLSDIQSSGITLAYYPDEVIGSATLDFAAIQGNNISMKTGATAGTMGRGIDVRIGIDVAAGDVASTEDGIQVLDNVIVNANVDTTNPLSAIDFFVYNAASIYRDLRVERNHVNTCGAAGISFQAGVYNYATIRDNKVRDPAQSVARSGFIFESGVVMTGQEISGNEARKETGASAMTYGLENKTSVNQIQSCLVARNHSRGHGTAGYLNMQHASNSRLANRMGDNALNGSFTATAGATSVITNQNAQAGMRVALFPTNAAAVALQGHATGGLYFGGTISAGVSFTLASTGGVAVGTETFDYAIDV